MKMQGKADILELELPNIIKKIAAEHNSHSFINNPDFFEKRLEKWHQFGLLTHTKKVRQAFLNELGALLKSWDIYEKAEIALSQEIDNAKKKDLLELSIILHDLGKIIVFDDARQNREHEAASTQLICQGFLNKKLISLKLTEKQIKYIADCVALHDIIGKQIRDELKHNNNLNLAFLSQPKAIEMCMALAGKYPDLKIEIGIYFLCDCLGKTDIRINASTDKEIIQKEPEIIKILQEKNLSQELKNAVMQLPVTLKLAQVYLKSVLY